MSYNVQCDNSTYTKRHNGRRKGEDNRTTDTVRASQSYLDVCINIPPVVKTTYYNRKTIKKTKGKYHSRTQTNKHNSDQYPICNGEYDVKKSEEFV